MDVGEIIIDNGMNEVACMKNSELCANKELVFKEKCGKIKECWQQIMQLNLKF